MTISRLVSFTLVLGAFAAAPAAAQNPIRQPPPIDVPASEVAIHITINALGTDVNAHPECDTLGVPCTHAHASNWGGFGAAIAPSVNITGHLALGGELGISASSWDSFASQAAHRSETNTVVTLLAGPTLSSGFFRYGRLQEAVRVFAQVLAGVETSSAVQTRGAIQISAGVDSIVHSNRGLVGGPSFVLRMAVGYRHAPGPGRDLSGVRFVFGAVLGPHEGN